MTVKDEWRYATVEYGVQCVQIVGIKWMQIYSVHSYIELYGQGGESLNCNHFVMN